MLIDAVDDRHRRRRRRAARDHRRARRAPRPPSRPPAATSPSGSADLDDLRDRAVAALPRASRCRACPTPAIRTSSSPDDLAPADTAGLDPDLVLGAGHRARAGRPATPRSWPGHSASRRWSRCAGHPGRAPTARWSPSTATSGVVRGRCSAETVAAVQRGRRRGDRAPRPPPRPGRTADGHPVALLANIGSARRPRGARRRLKASACSAPSSSSSTAATRRRTDEQVAAYPRSSRALPAGKVVVRTLDAGADKPLPFLGLADEPNPALGIRGLRVARRHPRCSTTSWTRSPRRPRRPAPTSG